MKAVVWALGLALASEASAFVPVSSAIHISSRTSLRSASVVCAAEGVPAGRREVLKRAAAFGGAILLNAPAALAADDDDDDGVKLSHATACNLQHCSIAPRKPCIEIP
jgi:hypothetical protein